MGKILLQSTGEMDGETMKRLKFACYSANLTMSVVSQLSPVLFLTFRSLYGISYSAMGFLVLTNFVTQLLVDLLFTFFSHRLPMEKVIRSMPLLAFFGMLLYAMTPVIFPGQIFLGLTISTVIFSAAAGLGEVLISPVIATIPAENPDREMSKLHSIYAWGVVGVITCSTLFLFLFRGNAWQYLVMLFLLIPLTSFLLFLVSPIPSIVTEETRAGVGALFRRKGIFLSVFAIFLGGAAECTMAQWSSGYLERALQIPKLWGDLLGVALFSAMLGLGRSAYAKYGKDPRRILFFGAVGATACYLVAAVSPFAWVGLVSCALTGLFTSMLWPGNLVIASEKFPGTGVMLYALMAAGGDLGASVAPQWMGVVTDFIIRLPQGASLAQRLSLTPEQFGLKVGMLMSAFFPLVGIFVFWKLWKKDRRETV